jgi:outer membrane protein
VKTLSIARLVALSLTLGTAYCNFAGAAESIDADNLDPDNMFGVALVGGSTLEDFYTAALEYSPRLRIAEENLNIGSARVRAANGQLLPQLSATASVSDNRRQTGPSDQNFDGDRYSLQLTQTLFSWQTFAGRKRAYASEDQSEAEYFSELASVLTDVTDRYLNVLQSEDALRLIQSEFEAVSNQLEQVESLYERQLTQITDLYQTQASLAAVRAEQLQLESQLQISRQALRSATGLEPVTLYRLRSDIEIAEVEQGMGYWTRLAQQSNYEIQAREYALKASKELVSERRGVYLPEVSLVVQRQNTNVGFDNAPLPKTDITYVGINVSVPLFAGGSNRAAVSEAASMQSIAENELRQIKLDVTERVRTAHLQLQNSQLQTQAAQSLVESATLSATAMQRGFELGTVTSVDVLNAIRNQYQAERDLQQTKYNHIRFLLELKREAGVLTAEDLVEVGSWLESPVN